jgi:hypothetical protein
MRKSGYLGLEGCFKRSLELYSQVVGPPLVPNGMAIFLVVGAAHHIHRERLHTECCALEKTHKRLGGVAWLHSGSGREVGLSLEFSDLVHRPANFGNRERRSDFLLRSF